jgi:hypothetical protein
MATPRKPAGGALPLRAHHLIADFRGLPRHAPGLGARETVSAADAILLALKHLDRDGPVRALAEHWPTIVGTRLASLTHPTGLNDRGVLVVSAGNAAARADLIFQRTAVLQKVRATPGYSNVKDLVVRAG